MEKKFTQGEWKAKLISTGEKPAHPVYWSIIFQDGYDPNRAAIDVYKGSKSTLEEAEANVKLISAAPDLLEALELVLKSHTGQGEITGVEVMKKVKAAINKATK